ncbi:hypothetical protein PENANT_c310G08581 [Penicillium antarcticum]|uniref:SNF2 N-terminal domain-containing protein n=1 Tax=Penicillium antarcticum TaxID=416450 RepID=A0A1V6NVD4_9EURO|nr:hypothetical protein PENANT_c310G08581 [Penicillium antarcticum]
MRPDLLDRQRPALPAPHCVVPREAIITAADTTDVLPPVYFDSAPMLDPSKDQAIEVLRQRPPYLPKALEQSPLHGGLLADAYGLRKTLSALTLIWTANQDLDPKDPTPPVLVTGTAQRTTREVDLEGNPVTATRQRTSPYRPAADPRTLNPDADEEEFDKDLLTDVEDEPTLADTPTPSPPINN